jgi:4-hydroxy-tetrahydrodipicolinate synthase
MDRLDFDGVLPANILPLTEQHEIDARGLERHVADLAAVPGVKGLVCNGHAGEVTALSREERRRVTEIIAGTLRGRLPVVSGVCAGGTAEAIEHARDAQRAGAAAILLCPPENWLISREPGAAQEFFRSVTAALDIPVIVFQYPHTWANATYDVETLVDLARIPGVVAVKEAPWEVNRYEEDYRALKRAAPGVAVLCANDEHLFLSYVIGCDGTLVGFAALVPDLVGALYRAVREGDIMRAREVHDRILPLVKVIYRRQPIARRHTRLKEALVMLGRLDRAVMKPPRLPLPADEREAVKRALTEANLL